MAVTVLKTTFPKAKQRIITHRTPYETKNLIYALTVNLGKMIENTYNKFDDSVNSVMSLCLPISKNHYEQMRRIS